MPGIIARIAFSGEIVAWRGPAPFLFLPVPAEHADELRHAAREASYGWGCVPASAMIGVTRFTTSLFPRADTYFLPVKVTVQRAEEVGLGDRVTAEIAILRP
jgi:hypothetical protein